MRFRIDLKIFLFILLFYLTKQIETYAIVMIFGILHEFGHLFAGLLVGMKPEKMELRPYGLSISFKLTPKDYNKKIGKGNLLETKKILVALAGPMVNFIAIMILLNCNFQIFSHLILIYANILLLLFNLLPIYPLDGGRILQSILHILLGKQKAKKINNIISLVIISLLTVVSSILIYKVKNIAIFIIIIFLWGIFLKEELIMKKRNKIYNLVKKTIEN